ncbi:MAG: uracil-DNA glycosylase family protein [Candidatus Thiodiazotropha lotti]|uniref:Uracil-DNA glycosylase family protein n=1 Tax=Candidatus Thiodiazotropha lotti TaxID=2792787 RepID=A0A9E4K6H9_9GAMM|nr:uracil-DNA glycosylase family protein [Candidatus Thiodiazotropha lotti]MCG7919985.1 uracil-DNA glycosylase family protein [Candidatus Thiodiazotropha lotti]MCG7932358.1 uracil-DNA glycosylase family protein [Candidatus Thiodiazotropha lotti]MCG7940482.1 uracil-DNA glycosylase family protein [Candidatus Thiodiazotropha lotti]MCG7986716.1 uracil-DNA glycosylase family protein [Candidatus Thiodiazotropha lotti]
MSRIELLQAHQQKLSACRLCQSMTGPVVMGNVTPSPILLIGQAPGDKEGSAGKPFAWTAGKTLFKWFDAIGMSESQFRNRVYMAAVCRCFPGKNPKGGDRVPSKAEIANCKRWLDREVELLQPKLLLPVGKLAISQFLDVDKLADIIGKQHRLSLAHGDTDLIPLPHPSGASTWHRTEPGKSLLAQALKLIRLHPAWQSVSE